MNKTPLKSQPIFTNVSFGIFLKLKNRTWRTSLFCAFVLLLAFPIRAQETNNKVNVFLGTSGDHGQLSPAASYPFSMVSIGPQTYPATHPGYEYYAKEFLGFTHNRMEGVGCRGDGGNLLIKPYQGKWDEHQKLIKKSQAGSPGYYAVSFENGIQAKFTVNKKLGIHQYTFSKNENGLYVDLSYAFVGRFVDEAHQLNPNGATGFIKSGTTCSRGVYKVFYDLVSNIPLKWKQIGNHQFLAKLPQGVKKVTLKIAFSSVDKAHAAQSISNKSFTELKQETANAWNKQLDNIAVKGTPEREKLFYSLLYRALQVPYVISENDGSYRANDGSLQTSKKTYYNGWAIWDNYKTQLPLLSLAYPKVYKDIPWSIAQLYKHGKKDFSTPNEPSQTVRTEHAVVVLLDALRKGYNVPLKEISDSLVAENQRLDFGSPDKGLESSYDTWALAEIFKELGEPKKSKKYKAKALQYTTYWNKDFKDLSKHDIDRMAARHMYQGTIWQYRWLVPYDMKGLEELSGGEKEFIDQLDQFFGHDYYSQANETDIQAPWLYFATQQPYKSEKLIHDIAIDTVTQFYFNGNSRGVDPYIGRIFQNKPKAFLRTMDDDAGAMSSWFALAGIGLSPACVGWPVYYVHVPLFKQVILHKNSENPFTITVKNYTKDKIYVKSISLNGKKLNRNWITQKEIMEGGELEIVSSKKPVKDIKFKPWKTKIND